MLNKKLYGGGQNNSKIQSELISSPELRPFLIFVDDVSKLSDENLTFFLYETQTKIQKIYNLFFSISFFLVALAIFIMFQKSTRRKNRLTVQNAIKDAHLDFSREIHDGIAQDLAALKFTLKSGDIEKANRFAEHAFNESRYLIEESQINLSGDFIQNIQNMLSSFEVNFSIPAEFLCASENVQKIPQKHKESLLKILNESLSNVARHSKATKVKVKIIDLADGFRFIVSDNGGGIKATSSKEILNLNADGNESPRVQNDVQNDKRKHFGLENIKQRAKEMNGEAHINFANEDGGTTVAITVKDFVR